MKKNFGRRVTLPKKIKCEYKCDMTYKYPQWININITLDSKLSFSAHIQAAIAKLRKAIGMLKFMSKCLSRNTLSELYKLYIRPHLDYGDVINPVPQRDDCSGNYLVEKLESVQYSAALAVTGTWRGTTYNF